MADFISCWKRIKDTTNIKNMSQLSKIVETTSSNVTKKKQKNIFPAEWAFTVGRKYKLLTEWILTGEGPKSLSEMNQENDQVEPDDPEKNERYGQWVECGWHDNIVKTVHIHIGKIYIVDPINPQRKKYRGERVKLMHYDPLEGCEVLRLESKWHVKRRHYIEMDICDLKLEKKKD